MKPTFVKELLFSEIHAVAERKNEYCTDPKRNFQRNRKLSIETVIKSIIGMGNKSLTNELIDMFIDSSSIPSASAFVQQRNKIKPDAFKAVLDGFTNKIMEQFQEDIPILAVDGSDVQISTNPHDETTFFEGTCGRKSYNLLHLNVLYDLDHHVYTDAVIQGGRHKDEMGALRIMVDRSPIPTALVIADRGYESYNNLAHIQEKGWFFLFRIRDTQSGIKTGFDLPDEDEFDEYISLKLTRRSNKETKELIKDRNHYKFIPKRCNFDYLNINPPRCSPVEYYDMNFRIVRFKITEDTYETVITNLHSDKYPAEKLKKLYAARWGIETSFRTLKYTLGMLDFHAKKVMSIQQEIYAHLIMYNFVEMITSHVVIKKKQRKYTYKTNCSVAIHMCKIFYHGKTTSPNLETIIARNTIPVRNERHLKRHIKVKIFHGFLYRVA